MVSLLPPTLFREEALTHRLRRTQTQSLLHRSRWIFPLTIVLFVLVLAVIFVLTLISYKATESARGILVAQQHPTQLVSPQAGVIEQLLVTNGQLVQAGTVVATVSRTLFDESGKPISDNTLEQLAAELEALETQAEFESRRSAHQLNILARSILDYEKQVDLATTTVETLGKQLAISGDLLQASEVLYKSGSLPKIQFEKQRLAHLQIEADQQNRLARMYELQGLLNQLSTESNSIKLEWEEKQGQLESSRQLLELRSQQTRNQEIFSIVARQEGSVASIPVSLGDSVNAGEALVYLQPIGEKLVGEVYVPPHIMGKLAPGQDLLLSYDGFDVESYGRYNATINRIDSASVNPRNHKLLPGLVGESVFRVQVLPDQHFVEGDDIFPLQPGLHFRAEFVTAEMTLIEFIFSPLLSLRGKWG